VNLAVENEDRGEVRCDVRFADPKESIVGTGATLQLALLRAFVIGVFGDEVDDTFPRRSQLLVGSKADIACNADSIGPPVEMPWPEGRVGDITFPPRP
jgi:hypothetical protein